MSIQKSFALIFVSGIVAITPMACEKAPEPVNADPAYTADAGHGQKLFNATCAACHGAMGQGMPRAGQNLRTSKFALEKTDAELVHFVSIGRLATDPASTLKVAMPPYGGNTKLSAHDLQDIIAHVRNLQKDEAAKNAPATQPK